MKELDKLLHKLEDSLDELVLIMSVCLFDDKDNKLEYGEMTCGALTKLTKFKLRNKECYNRHMQAIENFVHDKLPKVEELKVDDVNIYLDRLAGTICRRCIYTNQ